MENDIDSIIVKISSFCKYIREFDTKKHNVKQMSNPFSSENKQRAKRCKKQINIYDEIPQEVLDKSYRIFKSTKLLERFYCANYFKIWSIILKQKQFNKSTQNSNINVNESKILNLNGKKLINSNEINHSNKISEQNKVSDNLNTDLQGSIEEHTEDRSRISINMCDDEYLHENA